ncbi:hypothetical protein Thein_0440 [Thermodesulfatator indicus DSM 15286]|uniref:Cell division protein FtsL n=1 Tax=Thermodesulfatator indicus (strain DSM 15286 / JCM 11887 / CIR29812) TaxID=667014 RepID=F8AAP9_THEID|nr:hypothetical protein [Thermodesulfatator indicus]AEH44322.1 hypothetical protein Thein_0440 [Thermodesulfatator indicus DSM 15286]
MGARTAYVLNHKTRKSQATTLSLWGVWAKKFVLGMLAVLFLVGGALLGQKYFQYRSLKKEVALLSHQVTMLDREYQTLTSKEVVLKKAKEFGLHPPKKEQVVRLR